MKKRAIIVDIDGTIADHSHRNKWVKNDNPDWVKFHEDLINDKPIAWCVELVTGMAKHGYAIIFMTARPHEYWQETYDWLQKIFPLEDMGHTLICRRDDDFSSAPEYKSRMYQGFISRDFDVLFAIDDDPSVVETFRYLGLPTLDANLNTRKEAVENVEQ
ncbi:MAG: hypothetical protein HYR80_06760 [Nitrospirae bacterium]|nr:hypothetical protein [Nitrospirota bacterium]